MGWRSILSIILVVSIWSPLASAGQLSTYLQGIVVKKAKTYWIVQTRGGTYWINVLRHPSFTRKVSEIETGMWVHLRDIKRIRPNVVRASNDKLSEKIN